VVNTQKQTLRFFEQAKNYFIRASKNSGDEVANFSSQKM
jgi:hypothetical protein